MKDGGPRVFHVITSLVVAGAETVLWRLLSADRSSGSRVVGLRDMGAAGERIAALGVPVEALGLRRMADSLRAVAVLARRIRSARADVVQTWMYHADLLGGLAARLAGVPVAWGIRQTSLDPRGTRRSTLVVARACALLSRIVPRKIVCCSVASLRTHAAAGYAAEKMIVIPNGFDVASFRPDPRARSSVRRELGLAEDAPLVGLVGRFDPQKDHENFVRAAARLHAARPDVHFVLCGDGIDRGNRALAGWIDGGGLAGRFHLLGRRDDVARLDAALDVATSSSWGEGFPNAIGEAMACGVPCVVTDVGDSALLVGDTGRVVSPRDPEALADAWLALLRVGAEERLRLGALARKRIEERFELSSVAARYRRLHEEIARAGWS